MTKLDEVKDILHKTNASLVVCYANGEIKEYYQNRIKDIKTILQENENALKGAIIADKVIGKVAGSILAISGIKEIYTDVVSKLAIPVLEKYEVKYEYLKYIENNDKTGMCPMENKYKDEQNEEVIYKEMIG